MKNRTKLTRFFANAQNDTSLMPYCPIALKKRAAFTLAEVLITLGIIGVVAAMTIPTLTKSYQKKIAETRLKQTYSILQQALKLSEIDHGDLETWDIPDCSSQQNPIKSREFADEYIMKYIKGAKECDFSKCMPKACKFMNSTQQCAVDSSRSAMYTLQNGTILHFIPWGSFIYAEILTGSNNKAVMGQSLFAFHYKKSAVTDGNFNVSKAGIYFYGAGYDKDYLKTRSPFACSNSSSVSNAGAFCAQLIILNGWKVPDDMPW